MLRTLINQRLGRYTITELLGRGGMAAVYRATDSVLQRDVALKILHPQYSDDQSLATRFMREAVTAAALDHPNIVPVYDVGEHDGMAYIAMKLLSGETLQDRLQRTGPLDVAELCQILAPVAAALDYAHSRGVIHRDIKPGNIFLGQAAAGPPQVMLTDFGIAKRLDTPGLTSTGSLIGTPDYMAPEQIAGRAIDARTDVYALGMLAFRALTGRRAFEGSVQEVLMGHLYRPPPQPSSLAPGLSPAVDQAVLQAIASSPADRFASAGAFARALSAAAEATPAGVAIAPAAPHPSEATMSGMPPALARPQPAPPYQTRQPTRTMTSAAPAESPTAPTIGRGSVAPWVMAIILALLAGGLAVALGFLISERMSGPATGGGIGAGPATGDIPSPTPSITAVPTLPATATGVPVAAAGGAAEPTLAPSATASPAPSATPKPTAAPPPVPSATDIPSPTMEPSATSSPSPTAEPTDTPAPTITNTPSPTADCTAGLLQGGFGQLYQENVGVRTRLGCPQSGERAGKGAIQTFSDGTMFYWGMNPGELRDTIVIFYGLNAGAYAIVDANEAASYPEPPPGDNPNAPVRGFGRVYYGKAGVSAALGDPLSPEIELKDGDHAVIQFYAGGTMIYSPIYRQAGAGTIFVLYADGAFERYNDAPAQ